MKVRELIDLLNQVPDDLEVTVPDQGCGCCGGEDVTPRSAMTVQGKYDGRGGTVPGTETQTFFRVLP